MSTLVNLTKAEKANREPRRLQTMSEKRRRLPAGPGSGVVGIFINPAGTTSRLRAVVGGHTMPLLLESVFSFILFSRSIEGFIADHSQLHVLMISFAVRLLILVMATTDTEHPPSAGIAIEMASRKVDARGNWRHSRGPSAPGSDHAGTAATSARPAVSVPVASPNL